MYVFATSWSRSGPDGGLYQYSLDSDGCLKLLHSYLAGNPIGTTFVNKEKKVVYAVEESPSAADCHIYSFKIEGDGTLKHIGTAKPSGPCTAYVGWNNTLGIAIAANHCLPGSDPYVDLFRLDDNGCIGDLIDRNLHEGHGFLEKQNMPHPHCAVFSPDGNLCAVCDKGNDSVYMYSVANDRLSIASKWNSAPGYAPRYCAFHPSGRFFYHNNEEKSRICAYQRNGNAFTLIRDYEVVPGYLDPEGSIAQQGLAISASGEYIYSICKSCETIGAFKVDPGDGTLSHIQSFKGSFNGLRTLCISPDGKYMIAAYKDDGKLEALKISDGHLQKTGNYVDLPDAAGIDMYV